MSGLRQSHSITFSRPGFRPSFHVWFRSTVYVRLDILKFSFHHSSTKFLFKAGFHLKAVFMSFNVAFVPISRSRFKQCQIAPLRTFTNVLRFCVNFGMIFGHSVNEIFFSKDRLNWGKYEVLKIWWIWKIEFWSEELIDSKTWWCKAGKGPQTNMLPVNAGSVKDLISQK